MEAASVAIPMGGDGGLGLVVVMELLRSHFMDSGLILKVDQIGFAGRADMESVCVVKGN